VLIAITLSPEVAGLQGKTIGALAGQMSGGEAMGILVEYHCTIEGREGCTPIPLVASGGDAAISGVHVIQDGGEVVEGADGSTFTVTTEIYDSVSCPSLRSWEFYDCAYSTLSTLPAVDGTGHHLFLNEDRSTWTAWVVPEAGRMLPSSRRTGGARGEEGRPLYFLPRAPLQRV